MSGAGSQPRSGPLAGLTVLDVASYVAAPAAAAALADFGADVIKIEPPDGDPLRRLSSIAGMPVCQQDYAWWMDGRGKRSVVLDLNVEADHAALMRMAGKADVFITNYPARVLEKLRIRQEDLAGVNPRLIYAWLTGYGENGPEAGNPGFDAQAYWARSALMDLVREPGATPMPAMPGMGDHPSAMSLFGAVMMALYQRERTGAGQHVSVSLFANGLWANGVMLQAMLMGAQFIPIPARDERPNTLMNIFRCRDDRWFQLSLLSEEEQWPRLAQAVGRPDLEHDGRFATKAARLENAAALRDVLDAIFGAENWAHWAPRLRAARLPVGAISKLEDIVTDVQAKASGAIGDVTDASGAVVPVIAAPISFNGQPARPAGPPPRLDEHGAQIFKQFGIARDTE